MWSQLFRDNPATLLAIAGLFFFIAVFVAAVVWAMSRKRTDHYRRMANLPVDQDS